MSLLRKMAVSAALFAVSGCAVTQTNRNSLTTPAALINISSAPLAANVKGDFDFSKLKCGESDEVFHFRWFYPPVVITVGDESLKTAMKNGGIKKLYFADYTVRHILLFSWLTVKAYGE